eukprot:6215361-Pyramimonas_sp.AAC.1
MALVEEQECTRPSEARKALPTVFSGRRGGRPAAPRERPGPRGEAGRPCVELAGRRRIRSSTSPLQA